MKTLLIAVLALVSTGASRAAEMSIAVCCIRYAVESHPDVVSIRARLNKNPSVESEALLAKKQEELISRARLIIKDLAASRHYDYVFDTPKTRAEISIENRSGMLVDYLGVDISDEVAGRLLLQSDAQPRSK